MKEKIFFPPNRLPPSAQKVFDRYKDSPITSIQVRRDPLSSMITKVGNWISNGKFGEKMKELGYDDVFHLYMIVSVGKQKILVEKNQRINIATKSSLPLNSDVIDIPLKGKFLTLNSMFDKALKGLGDHDFFQYSVSNNNCQKFVRSLLLYSGLLFAEADKFIMQDAKKLVESLPSLADKFAQAVTDLAGKAQQVVEGGGAFSKKADQKQKNYVRKNK